MYSSGAMPGTSNLIDYQWSSELWAAIGLFGKYQAGIAIPFTLYLAGDEIDAMVHGFVASQEADGAWRSPQILEMWGLAKPPKQGVKYGNMDGATTYTVLLAIAAYRRAIYGEK